MNRQVQLSMSDLFIQCLQESVACMCSIVQHLTHDFHRLVALLKSCNGGPFVSKHSVQSDVLYSPSSAGYRPQ